MKFWDILKLLLGEATNILPLFIHNAKSQAVTGVLLTEANHAVDVAQALGSTPSVAFAQTSVESTAKP